MEGDKAGFAAKEPLLVGTAEVDITPPVGTLLAGSLNPRVSTGIEDPLYVKSIVFESGGKRLAFVIFDLVSCARSDGDRGIELSSNLTGIPSENIVWAATHTHTGPYTKHYSDHVNKEWLENVPVRMAECVASADRSKAPARFCHLRSFHYGLGHNRRIVLKNGKAINTWNLGQVSQDIQSIGSSGPVDPEIGILAFDDAEGKLMAVIFHFTLHTNTNFGSSFSADYPGVVAARLRERFGPQVATLFMPGACGDINTAGPRYRKVGDALAEKIISSLEARKPKNATLQLSSIKRELSVPMMDFETDQEEKISGSGWPAASQEYFRRQLELARAEGKEEASAVLQAWRIDDVGFASLPGELFVEWGLKIKKESPFAWTYPVELGGDSLGYLVTEKACQEGGYEPLISQIGKTAPRGVEMMVDEALRMLKQLKDNKKG